MGGSAEAAQRFVQQGNPFSVLMEGEPWLRCHTDIGLTSVTMVCPPVAHASPDGGRVLVSKDAALRDPGGPAASSPAVDVTEEEVLLAALDEAQWARNTDASACAEAADGHSALLRRRRQPSPRGRRQGGDTRMTRSAASGQGGYSLLPCARFWDCLIGPALPRPRHPGGKERRSRPRRCK